MRIDPSQLTVPQIAAAVAEGRLQLAEAEAELRRRPGERRPRPVPAAPAVRAAPGAADILRALVETQRELKVTSRRLAQLTDRIDNLAQLAARLEAAEAPTTATSRTRHAPRPRFQEREPELFAEVEEAERETGSEPRHRAA
jgi:hypothetical protein